MVLGAIAFVGLLAWAAWMVGTRPEDIKAAPEAERVESVQAELPFQILIPAYMPREFKRSGVDIRVDQTGPGGEAMVQLAYRTGTGATLFIREWVPINPEKEILATSRPIQTKWGKGWLLVEADLLAALWVDVGPTRISIYSRDLDRILPEQILQMAETLGPASNQQTFSFVVATPAIRALEPPPPVEIPIDSDGIQEVTLVVTPGGYSPLRFSVRQGVPVHLIFRQLGPVGCGNELIFPADPENPSSLRLDSAQDKQELTFIPQEPGEFLFYCSHQMYRGVLTVRP